ncbi:flagellin [Salimicrobium jeotgali]|uniref:Flagellin n=1 Tax=Salimicrobium jeotgali TaxID=1230341 RepID=K2FIA0_9BACI|nr:flagellin [Salimicrobium jeotgali]AKG05307.1 flagellin [Salimicrobium jeotgali]EKE30811.1 flagellin domain-containing protein [Salimicrobium jeotgali]MBM7697697.1 flagellin [Salimicrobium jeotgali]
MIINHNLGAMNAQRQMSANQNDMSNSMEKLSSGLRINRAGDDAAGLAISEKMRGQIRGLEQANRNAQDGVSMIQTAEGALNETHSILQRMRELSVQSANDTNTTADREELQKEVNELSKELSRIGNDTEFNTKNLIDGEFKGTFQIGSNQGQNIELEISDMRSNALNVTGAATYSGASSSSVTANYTAVDNTSATTNSTAAIATVSYTVEDDGSGGFNLVDSSSNTVATSTNGTDFEGVQNGDGTMDSITFGQALADGDAVDIDTTSSNATVTGAAGEQTITDHKLEAGSYTVNGNDLEDAKGNVIGTFNAGDGGYSDADGKVMLKASAAITDGTAISVGGINISDQANADEAIKTLDTAIETVSAERSKLGSYQNRLDHTINNLGTSAENLQAAESRIRDVDMAKEMMEMTKNNILSQASQSMLAQANQQPQSVLQLLQ